MNPIEEALKRIYANPEKRVVFWYDEGGVNRIDFESLQLPDVEKLVIAGNEFGIKYKILAEKPEGKFLVYSNKAKPEPASDWLYDLYLSGASFSTDPASLAMSEMGFPDDDNIRRIMTDKLLPFFKSEPKKREAKALMSAESGVRSAEGIELVLISVLCKVKNHAKIEYVLLALLKELADGKSDKIDELAKYGLEDALWRRLAIDFGYVNRTSPSITDFANCLFHDAFYPQIKDERYQLSHQALAFFNDWKNGTKTRQDFLKLADDSAAKLNVAADIASVEVGNFAALDVYREIDERIVKTLVADVERGSARTDDIAKIIGARKDGCRYKEFENEYLAIDAAANFFAALSAADLTAVDASDAVTKYANTWYKIDLEYRLFIEYYNAARREKDGTVDLFAALKAKVDGYYVSHYLLPQSVDFQKQVNALSSWNFEGHRMQQNFWKDRIATAGVSVCVIISDALRYEIAAELAEKIEATHRYSAKIESMVGVLPSYTQLGMAALLPQTKLDFVGTDNGTPTEWVLADGKSTKGLDARKAILEAATPKGNAIAYKDLMAMSKPECRVFQSSASVLYVYHNAIDAVGDKRESEEETPAAAREAIDEIIALIKKVGGDYRVSKFIVTADHGFLYQDKELGPEQYVQEMDAGVLDAQVVKNRFVIGNMLQDSQVLANYRTQDLGLELGADIKIAKGIMRMKHSGSGVKYVHGGAALQEIVVPVVEIQHVRSSREDVTPVEAEILVDGVGRITTNRFGVSVYQTSPVGEEFSKRIVKLGLHAPDGTPLSDEVQLVLDSEAENVPDRTKSAMLTLNRAANDLKTGSVELRMQTGKERGNGRIDWDVYKVKPMTLRLAVQNFFD